MNQNFRNFALWAVILLLLVALFNLFQSPSGQSGASEIDYSRFRTDTADGRVKSVVISGQEITGQYEDGSRFRTVAPENADYVTLLEDKGVSIQARQDDQKMSFLSVLVSCPLGVLDALAFAFAHSRSYSAFGSSGRAGSATKPLPSATLEFPASVRLRRASA